PDPDLVIRTSGEYRVSNFLLWQLAYSELAMLDVLWPDFGKEHLVKAIDDYCGRERRFGAIASKAR
ncbi:MAG: undecaprenyl diphosphate synthase family protein, partial [Pseudomonadota bacterium]